MKTIVLSMAVAAAMVATGCDGDRNVLLDKEFDTPMNLPPFAEINNNDYEPAFEAAIDEARKSITLISKCRDEATFRNTIIPFDRSRLHLDRLESIFFNLKETDATDTMNVMAKNIIPMRSAFSSEVYQNKALFERIKHVYETRDSAGLDSVQRRVVELYYRDFLRNGALLNEKDAVRLAEVNKELGMLSHQFGTNLLSETNNSFKLVIDSVADLAGLPDNLVEAAAERANKQGLKGKWVFSLHNASIMPFLQYSERHDLRKAMYEAYCNRGHNGGETDNREVARKILTLRQEKARLLGYKTFAHYAIETKMAEKPEIVDSFLNVVWVPALAKAKAELEEMKKFAYRYDKTTTIEACDWFYWAEKLRKAKHDLSETEISQYFEIGNVKKGLFACATKLYGVQFKEVKDAPLYNVENNELWQVCDSDGANLGVVYFDWYPRASKSGGAWCTSFREPLDDFEGHHTPAQVSVCCNFTKGVAGKPSLLTYDEVETMFHEFGHALQALFTKGCYVRTAGNVPGDYVEMPSQINELWADDSNYLKTFARHHETGEVIPDALIQKIEAAGGHNRGFASTEFLAAAILDLKWHSLPTDATVPDVDEFEKKVFDEIGLIPEIAPRYHTTYFSHIFDGGYSAGYYVYEWAEMLVCDIFAAFTEKGDIFDRETASRFRKICLSEVGDYDLNEQFVKFRGRKPDMKFLLEHRGFAKEEKKKVRVSTSVASPAPAKTPAVAPAE